MCGPTTDEEMENPQPPHHHGPVLTRVEKVNEEVTQVVHEMQENDGTRHQDATSPQQDDDEESPSKCHSFCNKLIDFYFTYEFLVLVVIVILLARAYPPLGAVYLAPQITATWIAVIFIFVMAGLGLKTSEFHNALQQVRFNLFVQCYNFGVVSAIVFGISRLLLSLQILDVNLADGMVICASLPMTINMVLVLTKSAGGNEAAAVFNAAFGNMIGVFLSPVLILGYIGVTGQVDLASVFYKLGLRVVLPICVGQVLQKTSKRVVEFVAKYKKYFKKAQMYTLVFIIYTVFCKTFASEMVSNVGNIFLMILFQFLCLCIVMVLAWILLRLFFRKDPQLRVMGLFGCTHKTVAMGVPLINAIYDGNPNIGVYTLPLLIWHPMQLVIGSALAPRLEKWVTTEMERLGSTSNNDVNEGQEDNESESSFNGKEVKERAEEDNEPTDLEEGSPSNEQEQTTESTSITVRNDEETEGK